MQYGNVIDCFGHEQNEKEWAAVGTDAEDNTVSRVGGDHNVSGGTSGGSHEVGGGTDWENALAGAQFFTPRPSRNTSA